MTEQGEITRVLLEARAGDAGALDRLIPLVYDDLRKVARNRLRLEPTGHTLDTTGLVHEAYLRLVDQTRVDWRNRSQFYAAAAVAMRRILVDYARRHATVKRGGGRQRVPLSAAHVPVEARAETLLELDRALERLSALDERLGRVVECRFFGGLTEAETADALGVSTRTVERDWMKAKGLLHLELASS